MATIDIDFTEVPDDYKGVEPGVYEAQVTSAPEVIEGVSKDGNPYTALDVKLGITHAEDAANSESVGRTLSDRIFLGDKPTKLKRLGMSAGLPMDGPLDPEDLDGKTVKVRVKQRSFQQDGETRTRADVADYIPPQA